MYKKINRCIGIKLNELPKVSVLEIKNVAVAVYFPLMFCSFDMPS